MRPVVRKYPPKTAGRYCSSVFFWRSAALTSFALQQISQDETEPEEWQASSQDSRQKEQIQVALPRQTRSQIRQQQQNEEEMQAAAMNTDKQTRARLHGEAEKQERVAKVATEARIELIPEISPSPRSHWIELHPIDNFQHRDARSESLSVNSLEEAIHDIHAVPEEPPAPLSYWIDLHPVDASILESASSPELPFLALHSSVAGVE